MQHSFISLPRRNKAQVDGNNPTIKNEQSLEINCATYQTLESPINRKDKCKEYLNFP